MLRGTRRSGLPYAVTVYRVLCREYCWAADFIRKESRESLYSNSHFCLSALLRIVGRIRADENSRAS
jgi:hypothetical protein